MPMVYGVTVTLLILVQSFEVRILVDQQEIMERSIKYDLDFFYNQPRIEIYSKVLNNSINYEYIISSIKSFSKIHKKFYITTIHEKIQDSVFLNNLNLLINELKEEGCEVYLCMTTSSKHLNFLNPLISILHYKDFGNVSDSADNFDYRKRMILADINLFNTFKNKSIKSILSVRRKTDERDVFFSKYTKPFDGIFRYISDDKDAKNKFPTYTELIDEYKKSYVSFIFETSTFTYLNSFTEKLFIAFATKTLPILYIKNKTQFHELKDMGFFLFNEHLGYTEVDDELSEELKCGKFIEIVDILNDMDIDDVKSLYEKYSDKLENNYNIVTSIINSNKKHSSDYIRINPLL